MRKFFKYLHVWLGIPAGVLITVICLTGAVMVFQQEILEMLYPERYFITSPLDSERLPLDSIVGRVNARLDCDTITSVQVFADPERNIQLALSSGTRSYVYIDPYTGTIAGRYNARQGFFHEVMTLHRWLMFSDRSVGRVIIGVSTLFFLIVLISGVVRWFPHSGKQAVQSFSVKWRGSGLARRVFDLHRILGVYGAMVLILLALTGLMWSFEWYRNGAANLFGIERSKGKSKSADKKNSLPMDRSDIWQRTVVAAMAQVPEFEYIRMDTTGSVTILPHSASHPRATDQYQYNAQKDSLKGVARYGEVHNAGYMMGWAYVLHTGAWGGTLTKWLTFMASLIGASLPTTGYVMYIRRMRRAKGRRKK